MPREPRALAPARPAPSPARSPAAPRPPEPAAGSPTAPAAEVGSPQASRRGDGDRRGGLACRAGAAGPEGRLPLPRPRLAPGHCEPSPGPPRLLPRSLARALPPSPAPRPRPTVSLSFSSLLTSLCPEAGPSCGRAPGGSKLRRGSWAAAVGACCGVRGAPTPTPEPGHELVWSSRAAAPSHGWAVSRMGAERCLLPGPGKSPPAAPG